MAGTGEFINSFAADPLEAFKLAERLENAGWDGRAAHIRSLTREALLDIGFPVQTSQILLQDVEELASL